MIKMDMNLQNENGNKKKKKKLQEYYLSRLFTHLLDI